jgi:hypothetical protein
MIWKIHYINSAFIAAFEHAGEPDQAVIDAYLAKTQRRMHPPKHDGVKRWYYLCSENLRVRLGTIGRPLEDFAGLAAKCLIGTNEIIGEFEGNRAYIGQRGSQLTLQSIEWLQGHADQEFPDGSAALAEISMQILDLRRATVIQQEIKEKYQWRKP